MDFSLGRVALAAVAVAAYKVRERREGKRGDTHGRGQPPLAQISSLAPPLQPAFPRPPPPPTPTMRRRMRRGAAVSRGRRRAGAGGAMVAASVACVFGEEAMPRPLPFCSALFPSLGGSLGSRAAARDWLDGGEGERGCASAGGVSRGHHTPWPAATFFFFIAHHTTLSFLHPRPSSRPPPPWPPPRRTCCPTCRRCSW